MKSSWAYLVVLLLAPTLMAQELNVGSKRFTESYILGEIIKQRADEIHEAKATHKQKSRASLKG